MLQAWDIIHWLAPDMLLLFIHQLKALKYSRKIIGLGDNFCPLGGVIKLLFFFLFLLILHKLALSEEIVLEVLMEELYWLNLLLFLELCINFPTSFSPSVYLSLVLPHFTWSYCKIYTFFLLPGNAEFQPKEELCTWKLNWVQSPFIVIIFCLIAI